MAPIGLLIWYLIDKRTNQWLAISGIFIGLYLTYDTFSNGLITGSMLNMKAAQSVYISLVYFAITILTTALLFDVYASKNIPMNVSGNFFTNKNLAERRKLIFGIAVILVLIFCILSFFNF